MIDYINLFQWTILSLTALCIGMSKTGVQGMMLLVVPYMAMAFGAKESTGVILPMLCMADIMAVAYYKRIADWKIVVKLLPTAILGFFVAIFVDKLIPTNEFQQLMGWTLALALIVMMWSEFFGKENKWMNKWWYSSVFGLLGGFTTMIGNAAGPVLSVYLLSMRKGKMEYIGINAWFFLVVNFLKI
ncbi:MAG: sulfite exporter TauE/SafE family protein, partial [Bacteroidaceae bacterium]|nr:sulfite exporter TauE/SafE family protein [Bacteroidaceae bacterium]